MIRTCGIWKSWYLKSLEQLSWQGHEFTEYTCEDYWHIFICVPQQRCSPSDISASYLSVNQLLKLIVMTVDLPVLANAQLFCSSGGYAVDIAVRLSPILSLGSMYAPEVKKSNFLCRINTRDAAIWVKHALCSSLLPFYVNCIAK